jgi:GGDEF domain-containing protein
VDNSSGGGLIAIRDAFRTPFQVAGTPVSAPASVGVALSNEGADEPQDLLRAADLAMYAIKVAAKRRPHPTLPAGAH